MQNNDSALENAASIAHYKASLNASLYTAAEGGIERNEAETPSHDELPQPLATTAFSGKKWQIEAPCGNLKKPISGGQGIRHGGCNLLQDNDLGESWQSCGTKSGTLCDELENEQLSDVIAAWSMLPPNIQEAILLYPFTIFPFRSFWVSPLIPHISHSAE